MDNIIFKKCINKKPSFTLKKCLNNYDNETLINLANKQHLLINMGKPIDSQFLNRKKLINDLYLRIYRHFEDDLLYLPPREIDFICNLLELDLTSKDTLEYEDCKFLHSLGYIYPYNYKNKIYPIIPKEIREIYKSIPKDKLDSKISLNNKLYSYAIALTQIHGIYTVEHFIDVWNKHNNDKIDLELAIYYLDMMYDRQDYFNFDYMYVVTNYPSNDYGYKLLDKKDKVYDIPSREDIDTYSKDKLNDASPYFH